MKKTVTLLMVVAIAFVLVGGVAYAWKGGGFGGYGGNCPFYGSVAPEKAQRFYNDTLPLRQKHLQLRGELMQLYAQPNPDWNAISKKQQEMLQLRTEMQKRAYESGIPFSGRMNSHRFGKGWYN